MKLKPGTYVVSHTGKMRRINLHDERQKYYMLGQENVREAARRAYELLEEKEREYDALFQAFMFNFSSSRRF